MYKEADTVVTTHHKYTPCVSPYKYIYNQKQEILSRTLLKRWESSEVLKCESSKVGLLSWLLRKRFNHEGHEYHEDFCFAGGERVGRKMGIGGGLLRVGRYGSLLRWMLHWFCHRSTDYVVHNIICASVLNIRESYFFMRSGLAKSSLSI
jgi:hypothetical protein